MICINCNSELQNFSVICPVCGCYTVKTHRLSLEAKLSRLVKEPVYIELKNDAISEKIVLTRKDVKHLTLPAGKYFLDVSFFQHKNTSSIIISNDRHILLKHRPSTGELLFIEK